MDLKKIIPVEAKTLHDLKIDPEIITDLIIKELFVHGKQVPRRLARDLKINTEIVQAVISELKKLEIVGMVGGSGMGTDYQYGLYPKGTERARNILDRDKYIGPAPVSFDEYIRITRQALDDGKQGFSINRKLMEEKFSHHLGYKDVLFQIGQAVCARKPAFVYGFPGNGKTFLCSSVVKLLPPMIVPYAVEVSNQLVRVFDPSCHVPIEGIDLEGYDERWVAVNPPLITAGGELTLEDLEVKYNTKFGCFDAPPQVKATGGVLLIDDLGRQRCGVEEIFNRFIIPLENKVDYLVLGGQRMEVPTDEIVLFSTNLDPMKIVDDAFLRRLPYKINVRNPTVEEYTDIWKSVIGKLGLKFNEKNIEEVLALYKRDKRGLRAVHPRDILNIIRDRKRYLEDPNVEITSDEVAEAYGIYFVRDLTLVETIE
ncbi:MAG: putative ATPase with chaperone activity, associated with Flp pilus assembly [Candidatus Rifleibacterium amylolyticum]|nr:MAG: putative ATPase with chaperone activity, associated with Flp pilus assembly [Candidatus Rifleibacterium amylolyticum]NLF97121.1 ATP-binding protein [Candidatus Riflebacteria bacterium]